MLAAGCVFTYSVPGLIWPVAAAAIWLAAEIATGALPRPKLDASALGRRALPHRRRDPGDPGAARGDQLGALGNFLDRLGDVQNAGGRLDSDLAARGPRLWPRGDFRVDASGEVGAILATLVGLAAVGYGAWWWLRRRDLAVPAALAGAM